MRLIKYANLVFLLFLFSRANGSNTAFFIFGDSSVDPGNNNYIHTIPDYQANYKPYGLNGFFKEPTGRFSDGRIIVDYLAEYANLPVLIPPYLEPNANYQHGVNFASGGAGILSTTNRENVVVDLKTQLEYFEKVRLSFMDKFGEEEAEKIISNAVYFISMGSNDYMGGYLGNPDMQSLYPNPEDYIKMVIGNLTQGIQELYGKGAKKFGFLSLCPLGCLPALRALNPKGHDAGCFEEASALAFAHNDALNAVLPYIQTLLKGFKYTNPNFYDWLLDRINDPTKYGFSEGASACCGTGPHRGAVTCGGKKKDLSYELCDDPDQYVWFDSFHATEEIHQQFAKVLWDGTSASGDNNAPPQQYLSLQHLFSDQLIIADLVDTNPEYMGMQML